jgi:hypothetical protein
LAGWFAEDEFWTSGLDASCGDGGGVWCSHDKPMASKHLTWVKGANAPPASCVFTDLRNHSDYNATMLIGRGACSDERRFVCEVRKKATAGKALQVECMELWGITEGDRYQILTGP